jgi:hypothetical protein
MPTPDQIAAMPTTPGSIVRARVPFEDESRVRAWELHADGKWWDTYGARRHVAQLRGVTVIHDAGETAAPAATTAWNALGHDAEIRIRGLVYQDDHGIYVTDPGGRRWNLHHDDPVTITPALEVAS